MTTLDLTGSRVDLKIKAGTDAVFTVEFDAAVDTWSGWTAKVVDKTGTTYSLGVDAADAANGNIVLSLTAAQTAAIPTGSKWQFSATDDSDDVRALLKGSVNFEEDFTA